MNQEEVSSYFSKYRSFIEDFEEFTQAVLKPARQGFVVNTLKISIAELLERLKKYPEIKITQYQNENYFFCDYLSYDNDEDLPVFNIGKTVEHNLGLFYIMGISSYLSANSLSLKSNKVIDFCAAPGGKTFVLATKLNNQGCIIANELKKGRCRVLRAQLSKYGVLNTVVTNGDASKLKLDEKFSSILLDGPCSAEGTMRGQFQVMKRWKKDQGFRQRLHQMQKNILFNAFEQLEVGGEMIYSTCTYDPFENEFPLNQLIQERGAKLLPLVIKDSCDGLTHFKDETVNEKFDESLTLARRLYPHKMNTWGFFLARITKTAN